MNVFDTSDESFSNFMNVYFTTLKVKRVVFVNDKHVQSSAFNTLHQRVWYKVKKHFITKIVEMWKIKNQTTVD